MFFTNPHEEGHILESNKKTPLTLRIKSFLVVLNQGQKLCIHVLALEKKNIMHLKKKKKKRLKQREIQE
jgi:hypothetical protein